MFFADVGDRVLELFPREVLVGLGTGPQSTVESSSLMSFQFAELKFMSSSKQEVKIVFVPMMIELVDS